MAAVTMAPGLPVARSRSATFDELSTLPDPRSPLASSGLSRSNSNSPHHPDLNNEVATLSNKLISAINHQTSLDDTLSETRHELDFYRERTRQLEAELLEHKTMISSGELVRQQDVEAKTVKLMANLADEKKRRGVVEKDKKGIEQELETLTTALFEEANEMVSAARKERELAEKRNEALRSQLNDTELLLASHQEQLAELKSVMQEMSSARDEPDSNTNASTTPSTPGLGTQEHMTKIFDALHLSPTTPGGDEIPPAPPTSFTHLLHPVLRNDLPAYEDFYALLQTSRKPSSRVTSGTYGGLSVVGLGKLTDREHAQSTGHLPSNGSNSSLSTAGTYQSSPITPSSTNSSVSSRDVSFNSAPLKETRFYKRVLSEDIEPTLRLDTAPGLSWLARRTVINSMSEGSLVIEPMPTVPRLYVTSCSLCGENRKGDGYARSHRFKTSDNESAQRYPLCNYCLNRMRASCDFLGFLRMVKDGHWRADGVQAGALAWEESVRLRERMFWARIGGGVIPTFVRARDSPRSSVEGEANSSAPEQTAALDNGGLKIHGLSHKESEDPFVSNEKHASIGHRILSQPESNIGNDHTQETSNDPMEPGQPGSSPPQTEDELIEKQIQSSLEGSLRDEARPREQWDPTPGHETLSLVDKPPPLEFKRPNLSKPNSEHRLSVTIPGAFDF